MEHSGSGLRGGVAEDKGKGEGLDENIKEPVFERVRIRQTLLEHSQEPEKLRETCPIAWP